MAEAALAYPMTDVVGPRDAVRDRSENSYYEQAYERYRERLRRYAARRLTDPEDVADVVHDAYYRLVRYERSDSIQNTQAFLFTTTSNLLRDRFRRARTRMRDSHVCADDVELVARTFAPDQQLALEEIRSCLRNALGELDQESRQAFILHRVDHLTHAKIADRMGTTVGVVRRYIRNALTHCKRRLSEHLGKR
jgi:RNA polymerase sigma-70 factor (ECF subfamily)